jgi:uncharacterized protein (UPF0305 family)
MFAELDDMIKENNDSKQDLVDILRNKSKDISVFDQMKCTNELWEGLKYVQGKHKKDFFDVYCKHFILRINDIKDDKTDYDDERFDFEEFVKSVVMLETNFNEVDDKEVMKSEAFRYIYAIISLYTTFILDEPIHPAGTKFPGELEVEYKDGVYYCPVKENNEDNPKAICQFCIAEQLEYD